MQVERGLDGVGGRKVEGKGTLHRGRIEYGESTHPGLRIEDQLTAGPNSMMGWYLRVGRDSGLQKLNRNARTFLA